MDYRTGESSPVIWEKQMSDMVSFFPVTGLLYSTGHNR
jgi:hypothetical protein